MNPILVTNWGSSTFNWTLLKFEFIDCKNYPITSNGKSGTNKGTFKINEYEHKSDESKGIVDIIKELNDYKNTAVLFTTLNYFDLLAKDLNNANIPFISFGGKTYLKPYIRFLIYILRLIQDRSNIFWWRYICEFLELPSDSPLKKLNLNDIINTLQEGLKPTQVSNESLEYILTIKSPSKALSLISNHFLPRIKTLSEYHDSEIKTDIDNLISISESYKTLDDFLTSFALNKELFKVFYKKELEIESKLQDTKNAVTLSTIHSAKGLEWENVIIAGLSYGIFPNPYFCKVDHDPQKTCSNYNDEFKKLYVAMSRSTNTLILTYPLAYDNKYGKTFHVEKSMFLKIIEK